jgi:hypothetical protein
MSGKTFVYTELQASVPFASAPWREINPVILQQPGFRNKTWLSGVGNQSIGGFYEFDSLANARRFVTHYFPSEARKLGAAQTTRLFDGDVTTQASVGLNSMHYDGVFEREPGAYLYTEVQFSVPFDQAPWRQLNPMLKAQPGLMHKTWLSGISTQSVGGFYAFDTLENASRFALEQFPREAANLGAAYTTRLFDAAVTARASLDLHSPFYGAPAGVL